MIDNCSDEIKHMYEHWKQSNVLTMNIKTIVLSFIKTHCSTHGNSEKGAQVIFVIWSVSGKWLVTIWCKYHGLTKYIARYKFQQCIGTQVWTSNNMVNE